MGCLDPLWRHADNHSLVFLIWAHTKGGTAALAQLVTDLNDFPAERRGGIVSIGNFDGVHRGHTCIAERTARWAHELGVSAVVLTFDPHPSTLLRPDQSPPQLAWIERRCELLGECGIDTVVVYRTDMGLLQLTPRDFFERIVVGRLAAKGMVEGENFRFGRRRKGTIKTLTQLASDQAMSVEVVEPRLYGDAPVSSSRIRSALESGNVEEAASMLGRPHRIRGKVTAGAGRGRGIGFPSANLSEIQAVLPAEGVYAGCAFAAGQTWAAAVNLGPNPTFGETQQKVEAHLIGFEGDLYGATLEIDFLKRLRGVVPFSSVDALKDQIHRDIERTEELAAPVLTSEK